MKNIFDFLLSKLIYVVSLTIIIGCMWSVWRDLEQSSWLGVYALVILCIALVIFAFELKKPLMEKLLKWFEDIMKND